MREATRSVGTRFTPAWLRWLALLGLCAAYLQGGLVKAFAFDGAVAEMVHFGMAPAAPLAAAVIVLELGASLLILSGAYRWLGALALAGFTLVAACVANRYWEMSGMQRFAAMNAFYEHLGLVGGFVLVAWHDLRERAHG
ncbi:putative membrane protein YphA (DoxX/SURF4 family) [Xanthomonas sp. JAI131]|uniref:DoxX family protein n=1 Tax=Xanthomonas sp. JAI131 TaxID=2723067 RepID=UPI0015CB58A6|nr:DoxX family protein [Xanthomonas sp. JAI131]NYF22239.1 putative membrane protein YphA (DoxX/SURF4 family) [Xanthomonas sp. JAI131]